jgi:hypothetical protein
MPPKLRPPERDRTFTCQVIAVPSVWVKSLGMTDQQTALADPLVGLAAGRIALGVAALVAPRRLTSGFGMSSTPATDYLTRIYGARALALGAGYLTEPKSQRGRWHRIGLAVDVSDSVTALGHLVRRDVPKPSILALGGLTGGYMVVGLIQLLRQRADR